MREKGPPQLGSLGGGNHFLELCQDEDGLVWLLLHSGSRGAGNLIASHHIAIARELGQRLGIPSARDLWVLPLDRPEGRDYLRDMLWAQDYAMENRQRMRWAFVELFRDLLKARRPSARRSGSTARGRRSRARASSGSSPARWRPGRTSCAGWATRSPSPPARTGRGG